MSFYRASGSPGSGGLERKASTLFDPKIQKQKKEEADQRAVRERQQSEYATRKNLQELFSQMAEAITSQGALTTEAEANKRIYEFLLRRKQAKEESKKRIHFIHSIRIDVKPHISMKLEVVSSSHGDIQLTMKNVLGNNYTIDDVVALSWEQFAEWEQLALKLAALPDSGKRSSMDATYAIIYADGKATAAVEALPDAKKIVDKLWGLCMEFRQSSKRVGVFQPL